MNVWIGLTFLAFAIALVSTRLLIQVLNARGVLDVPNARSSHDRPTPRGGGIGILVGIGTASACAALMGLSLPAVGFWAGAVLLALTGWVDDRLGGLSPALRLVLQIVAALLALFGTGGLPQVPFPNPANVDMGVLALPLAVLWVVAVTNIYNFLDGIDGYAVMQGGIAGFALLSLVGNEPVLGLGGMVAGACAGFGVYNWHRARIFMGDVGSGTLGFLFAALPFHAGRVAVPELVFVVALALWFFLADGVYTLVRRSLKGERIWEAHRSHIYQRLVQTNLKHDQVVLRIAALAVPVAVAGCLAFRLEGWGWGWGALLLGAITFLALVAYTRRREYSASKEQQSTMRRSGVPEYL